MKKLLVAFCMFGSFIFGEAQNLKELVESNTYPLRIENGKLRGQGGELLLFEATKAQVFIIGEEKGVAEIPDIIWAIYQHAYRIGLKFDHLALEVSPYYSAWLQETALQANAKSILTDYFSEYKGEVPYLELSEEITLIENVLETASSDAYVLWGIAPETLLGARAVLERLSSLSTSKTADKIIARWLADAEKDKEELFSERDSSALFFYQANPAELEALKEEFTDSKEAILLINGLLEAQIVHSMEKDGTSREAIRTRANRIKANYNYYYKLVRESQVNLPRVIVKLDYQDAFATSYPGTNIATPASQFISINQQQGKQAFNLLVIAGAQDSVSVLSPDGTYEALPGIASQSWIQPLIEEISAEGLSLLNLRKIRAQGEALYRSLDERLIGILKGYDAILVIGGSTPASFQ